nr:MAG TPA_asm: hypothetical protein [Caudoviricetes sp.]
MLVRWYEKIPSYNLKTCIYLNILFYCYGCN